MVYSLVCFKKLAVAAFLDEYSRRIKSNYFIIVNAESKYSLKAFAVHM
jgi:hypothetical protein